MWRLPLASDNMKTMPLRTLLRDPIKVKRLTKAGTIVRITDKGQPLWDLQPVVSEENDEERARLIDEILAETLKEKPGKISAVKILLESRR